MRPSLRHALLASALAFAPACGALQVYEGHERPPEEVATITTVKHSLLGVPTAAVDLVAVDGETLGLFHKTAEVLPGPHVVTARRGAGAGAKAEMQLTLDARAGHVYAVDAADLSRSPPTVTIWIIDERDGSLVAGTPPPPKPGETAPTAAYSPPVETPPATAATAAAATSAAADPSESTKPVVPSPTASDPTPAAPSANPPLVPPAASPAARAAPIAPPPLAAAEELWIGTRRAGVDGTPAPMTLRLRAILGGAGRCEEIEVRNGERPYRGFSVETFDDTASVWVRQYVNVVNGRFVRMEGTKDGGRGFWTVLSDDPKHGSRLEVSWSDATHWRRTQSVSDDGGRTWRVLWSDELTRADPP